MKKSKFEEQITTSFKSVTPDVLDKIKSSNQFFVPEKVNKYDFSRFFNKRLSYSLASIFVLVLIVFGVMAGDTNIDTVVASTVTIDINPSVEITLDEYDNVINITAINDDGELLIDRDINFKGLSLDRAIELIIAEAIKQGVISEDFDDTTILIDVSSESLDTKARVENMLEVKITAEMAKAARAVVIRRENRDELTTDEVINLGDIAKQYKISLAKLHLINRIIEVDDSYTILELSTESIRELYRILYTLVPEDDSDPGNNNDSGNN